MSKQTHFDKRFWIIVSLALVLGLIAGICGAIVARNFFPADYSSTFSSDLNLSNLNANNSGLVIRDAKKVVVNQDVKITETISNIRPVLVSVFKEIPLTSSANNYYKLDEPLFLGLIITSDGWVVAQVPNDLKADFKFKNYVVIANDRQQYKIDKVASLKNLPGDPLIFHLAGASNLPVKKIVPRAELGLGETLLVINGFNNVWPTTLTSLTKTPAVLSSDSANARLNLSGFDNVNYKDSFVFDLAGDLTALITSDQKIIPAFSYNSSWSSLSKKNQIAKPFLGVSYLDLSVVKAPSVNLDKGAWIFPAGTQPAIAKDSPAQLAGLKAGDVITWVNNQEINADNDLADVLADYKAGDKVTLTYVRAGAENAVDVTLGAQK